MAGVGKRRRGEDGKRGYAQTERAAARGEEERGREMVPSLFIWIKLKCIVNLCKKGNITSMGGSVR